MNESKYVPIEKLNKEVEYEEIQAENLNVLKIEAYRYLAEVCFKEGNFKRALRYNKKCEKMGELVSGNFLTEKFLIQVEKTIYLNQGLDKVERIGKYLTNIFASVQYLFEELKLNPNLLNKIKEKDLFFDSLFNYFDVLITYQLPAKCAKLIEFIVENYDYLKLDSKLEDRHKYHLYELIRKVINTLSWHYNEIEFKVKLLIFVVDNFASLNFENFQMRYKKIFFRLIVNLKLLVGYKIFDKYSSLYLEKYQVNEDKTIDPKILDVIFRRCSKFSDKNNEKLLACLKTFKNYTSNKIDLVDQKDINEYYHYEFIYWANKGQYSTAETIIQKIILRSDKPEDDKYHYYSMLGGYARRFEQHLICCKYYRKKIKILDTHSNIDYWDLKYAECHYFLGDLYLRTDRIDEAEKVWQKCVDLYDVGYWRGRITELVHRCKVQLDAFKYPRQLLTSSFGPGTVYYPQGLENKGKKR